jgi:hypothetical protein
MHDVGTEYAPIVIDDEESETPNNAPATSALTRKNTDIDWAHTMQLSPGYNMLHNMGYIPGKALGPAHSGMSTISERIIQICLNKDYLL